MCAQPRARRPLPIASPGRERAWNVVLNPAEGDWLWYVLDVEAGDGSSLFHRTTTTSSWPPRIGASRPGQLWAPTRCGGGPVTGATRVAAVIGSPVRHSLSPVLLNAAFSGRGASTGCSPCSMSPRGGRRGCGGRPCARSAWAGCQSRCRTRRPCTRPSTSARRSPTTLGAVNCVFHRDGRLVGDNTDGPGFLDALRHRRGIRAGRTSLRAGGCGRGGPGGGAGPRHRRARPRWSSCTGRPTRRGEWPRSLRCRGPGRGSHGDVATAELVVNATSLGMAGGPGGGRVLPLDPRPAAAGPGRRRPGSTTPSSIRLLAAAWARGAVAVERRRDAGAPGRPCLRPAGPARPLRSERWPPLSGTSWAAARRPTAVRHTADNVATLRVTSTSAGGGRPNAGGVGDGAA